MTEPRWIGWARRLQAIAQNGLYHSKEPFDLERYEQVLEIAREIIASGTETDFETVKGLVNSGFGYRTPKVAVRGVVFDKQGRLLLVREDRLDAGKWALPGGWADINEGPAYSTEREVLEEAGYVVRAVKLLAVVDKLQHNYPPSLHHSYILFYRCELLQDTPVESPQGDIETSEATFFAETDIPPENDLSLARTNREHLLRFFEHYHNPGWPTDYD